MKWFIADTHFGHGGVIQYMHRCYPGTKVLFPTVEAHDQHLIGAINVCVHREDALYILGDFAIEKPGKYRMQINCKHVHLILGNHDSEAKCRNVFGETPLMRTIKLRGDDGASLRTVLCHFPLAYWDGSHRGWAHLYGHTHSQREHTLNAAFTWNRRSMDVGADNLRKVYGNFFPISEVELYNMFISRPGHDDVGVYEQLKQNREDELDKVRPCGRV